MTIDLSKITPQMIQAAVLVDDLDAAISPLQDAAGITDGGVADMAFTQRDTWEGVGKATREEQIKDWINLEKIHAIRTEPKNPLTVLYVWGSYDSTIIGPFASEDVAKGWATSRFKGLNCDWATYTMCRPEDYSTREDDDPNEALFKIFQMTRRYCDDLGTALSDSLWDENGHKGIGFLYGDLFIEIQQDWWPDEAKAQGRYHLLIERDERITNDLESLERDLFEFATGTNCLTFEQATDDLTVDLFEGDGVPSEQRKKHISRGPLSNIIKENKDSMEAEEVATMRKALVENGTYRIVGFVGCWWDVVLVKPADPATFPPKPATQEG